VIVGAPAGARELRLRFPDPQLRDPTRVDLASGAASALGAGNRESAALTVRFATREPVTLLRLSRATALELEGIAERVEVSSDREMPVEEILRRLQASEDDQIRRLRHYQATNATTLRFQPGAGLQSIEATFEGEFFYRQGLGFDWAWAEPLHQRRSLAE